MADLQDSFELHECAKNMTETLAQIQPSFMLRVLAREFLAELPEIDPVTQNKRIAWVATALGIVATELLGREKQHERENRPSEFDTSGLPRQETAKEFTFSSSGPGPFIAPEDTRVIAVPAGFHDAATVAKMGLNAQYGKEAQNGTVETEEESPREEVELVSLDALGPPKLVQDTTRGPDGKVTETQKRKMAALLDAGQTPKEVAEVFGIAHVPSVGRFASKYRKE